LRYNGVDVAVGVDLGVKDLAVLSTGEKIANPKHLAKSQKRLKRAQQSLNRKVKGSKNREKARRKVARLHAQIAEPSSLSRLDSLHTLTTRLTRENQTICVESLAVKNMARNRALAKARSDVGWGEFIRQLTYKAAWYGARSSPLIVGIPVANAVLRVGTPSRRSTWTCGSGRVQPVT
jgi:putative transposase